MREATSEDGGGDGPEALVMDYGTNLWLGVPKMTNGAACVTLHNVTEGEVYELMSSPVLPATKWNPEQALFTVSNQDWDFNNGAGAGPDRKRFLSRAGLDGNRRRNSNSAPDWWDWVNYGPPVAYSQTLHTPTQHAAQHLFLQAADPEGNLLTYIFPNQQLTAHCPDAALHDVYTNSGLRWTG